MKKGSMNPTHFGGGVSLPTLLGIFVVGDGQMFLVHTLGSLGREACRSIRVSQDRHQAGFCYLFAVCLIEIYQGIEGFILQGDVKLPL